MTHAEFLALFRETERQADLLVADGGHLKAAQLFKDALDTLAARGVSGRLDHDLAIAGLAFEVVRLTTRAKKTFARDRREALDLAARHRAAMARAAARRDLKPAHHRSRGDMTVMIAKLRLLEDDAFPDALEIQQAIDHFHAAYLADGQSDRAARRFEKDVRWAFATLRLGRGVYASGKDQAEFHETLRDMQVGAVLPVVRLRHRADAEGWAGIYMYWLRRGLKMAADSSRGAEAIAFSDEMVAAARTATQTAIQSADDVDMLMMARLVQIKMTIKFETCQSAHAALNEITAEIRDHEGHEAQPLWQARAVMLWAPCMPTTASRNQKYHEALRALDPLLDKRSVAAKAYEMRKEIWRLIEPGRIVGGAQARPMRKADLARVGAVLGLNEDELRFADIVGLGNLDVLRRLAKSRAQDSGAD